MRVNLDWIDGGTAVLVGLYLWLVVLPRRKRRQERNENPLRWN